MSVADPFRWNDGERVIAFGPLDEALPLLGDAYTLLTTERAAGAAPSAATGAREVLTVGSGRVDELAFELRSRVRGNLVVALGGGRVIDVAKALALGADAVSIGTAALVALGDNDPALEAEYNALGTTAGAYDDWHEGRDPAGITTQDPKLASRLDPVLAGRRLANYLSVLTLEAQTIARACGKSHVHNLEPEDLCALTVEAAAMARPHRSAFARAPWDCYRPGTSAA